MEPTASLQQQIDVAAWEWLRPHLERGHIIRVATSLDLAGVGQALADDNAREVEQWVAAGLLGKPDAAQVDDWNRQPARLFRTLIVSPFVLIQEPEATP